MAIKHLPGFTSEEIKKLNPDIPFYERREIWMSPLAIPLIIGFIIFITFLGFSYAFKWIFLSWIVPFVNWKWFCKIELHKYRKIEQKIEQRIEQDFQPKYVCIVCKKEKFQAIY